MNDELGGLEDSANTVKGILDNINATNFDQLKSKKPKQRLKSWFKGFCKSKRRYTRGILQSNYYQRA